MSGDPGRGVHDMGGLPAGSIERAEHAHALWEKRVDALMVLLGSPERRVITVDQLRRGIVRSQVLGAARLDSRHGFSSVCDQDGFTLAHLVEQSAEVVLRFANAGPFHPASLARIKRPVKRDR